MKIGLLITVRLKSSRLAKKVLLPLSGKTVLEHVIERAKAIKGLDRVVVCTSTNPQDRPIAEIALASGVHCYQGSEEDVIQRLTTAAQFHELDGFISITADNPLFSVSHAEKLLAEAQKSKADLIEVTNVPLGMATYFLLTKAVVAVCKMKNVSDTEFWPVLIKRPELFTLETLDGGLKDIEHWRLTLDIEDDYKLFQAVYNAIPSSPYLKEEDAISYLRAHPEVLALNSHYKRTWLDSDTIAKIDKHFQSSLESHKRIKQEVYGEGS